MLSEKHFVEFDKKINYAIKDAKMKSLSNSKLDNKYFNNLKFLHYSRPIPENLSENLENLLGLNPFKSYNIYDDMDESIDLHAIEDLLLRENLNEL